MAPEDLIVSSPTLVSPPETLARLLSILDNPHANLGDAHRLIEYDPGLSTRVLKLVNSALYGLPGKVSTISRAVSLIGARDIRNLAVATLVMDRFSTLPDGLISMRQFWSVSVRTALWARELAKRLPDNHHPVENDTLFLCGLLREIGCLVMYHEIPELARAAVMRARAEKRPDHEVEREMLGFDHYAVGAALSKHWRLPEIIAEVQTYLNTPEQAPRWKGETLLIRLAGLVGQITESLAAREIPSSAEPLMQALALTDQHLLEAEHEVEANFEQIWRAIYSQ
ncbi:MAG TPA: HDOD domain-containing protein [Methylococcaceae bacterium]|nr:HDOD domain-containing protein [Methylococcaceae bacterium]